MIYRCIDESCHPYWPQLCWPVTGVVLLTPPLTHSAPHPPRPLTHPAPPLSPQSSPVTTWVPTWSCWRTWARWPASSYVPHPSLTPPPRAPTPHLPRPLSLTPVLTGNDPSTNVVLLEDLGAVTGVVLLTPPLTHPTPSLPPQSSPVTTRVPTWSCWRTWARWPASSYVPHPSLTLPPTTPRPLTHPAPSHPSPHR